MKTEDKTLSFSLNRQAVDEISDHAIEYFTSLGTEKRNTARYRLAVEELLLQWMDKYGEGATVTVSTGRRFFRENFVLEIEGAAYDPFKAGQEEMGLYSTSVLRSVGVVPEYVYTGSVNRFTFKAKKKKMNPIFSLLITIAAALLVGFLGVLLIPESFRMMLIDSVITPVHDMFLSILGCAAGPMIFLSVAWGIYGIGDTTTLSKIGKKMIFNYIGTLFLILTIACGVMIPFFKLNFAVASGGPDSLDAIFKMFLDIIPKNIFSPFIDGNSLQIIYLAIIIGIAMLFLGKKTSAVARAVEQINYIVQFLMEFISTLVPYFIFIVVVKFVWSDTLASMAGVAKYILVFICAIAVMAIAIILVTARRHRVDPILLLKKGLPTLFIAITTASSAASFGTNMNACETKYGIDRSITSFGIPLGMVMFKPTTALGYMACALYFAEVYHVECSVTWVILAIAVVGILAIATPPIPGGALTAYTIIFTQLGIPLEALSIVLAVDIIVDFLDTGFDQFVLPFALVEQARKIGMLDEDTLHKKIG